jgi:hypothetical protein
MLKQLVYLSTAARDFSATDLDEILAASRRNNNALAITGLLIVKDHQFIQVLEGEAEAVQTLFKRISEDPRHRDVSLVSWEYINERSFPQWSMGFKHGDELSGAIREKLVDFEQTEVTSLCQNSAWVSEFLQALLALD